MNRRGNRNPLDEKIDLLSPAAIKILSEHRGLHMIVPIPDGSEVPWAVCELLEQEFFSLAEHETPNELKVTITFQGNKAQLRINGGVYAAQLPPQPPKPGLTDDAMDQMREMAMF